MNYIFVNVIVTNGILTYGIAMILLSVSVLRVFFAVRHSDECHYNIPYVAPPMLTLD